MLITTSVHSAYVYRYSSNHQSWMHPTDPRGGVGLQWGSHCVSDLRLTACSAPSLLPPLLNFVRGVLCFRILSSPVNTRSLRRMVKFDSDIVFPVPAFHIVILYRWVLCCSSSEWRHVQMFNSPARSGGTYGCFSKIFLLKSCLISVASLKLNAGGLDSSCEPHFDLEQQSWKTKIPTKQTRREHN